MRRLRLSHKIEYAMSYRLYYLLLLLQITHVAHRIQILPIHVIVHHVVRIKFTHVSALCVYLIAVLSYNLLEKLRC